MTVPVGNRFLRPCNGSAVLFDVSGPVYAEGDLFVALVDNVTKAYSQLVLETEYSVENLGRSTGARVRTVTAYPSGKSLLILLDMDLSQVSSLRNLGRFDAATFETVLDKQQRQIQQLSERVDRCISLDVVDEGPVVLSSTPAQRKAKFLKFDADDGTTIGVADGTGAGATDFLGLPSEGSEAEMETVVLVQTPAQVGTNQTTTVPIDAVLNKPLEQVNHEVDASLSPAQLPIYNTNADADDVLTFTLPPGYENAWGYVGRIADHQVRLQPDGTEAWIGGQAGEFLALMAGGYIGYQWLDGYWQIFDPGCRVAYETPKARNGELWLDDDPQLDLTGVDAAATRMAALFAKGVSDALVLKGRDARLSIGTSLAASAPLHGPSFPYSSTHARLKLVPSFTSSPITVTGCAASSGLIRLTVTSHGRSTGDTVYVADVGGVPAATGAWIASVINANTIDLLGSTFSGAFTSGGTLQYCPAVLDRVSSDGADLKNLFVGDPGNGGPSSISYPSVGLRLGRPGRTPDTTYRSARYDVEAMLYYGMTIGLQVQGWSGDLLRQRAENCAVGFHIDTPNDCTLELRASACRQGWKIENGNAVNLRALMEGNEANMVASTIDNIGALQGVIYLEQQTNGATDYLLKIGSVAAVSGDLVINVGAQMSLTGNKPPILLDRVTGTVLIRGSAGDMHSLYQTTANCEAKIIVEKILGQWPLEGASASRNGPAYNFFPNSDLSGWVAGAAFPRGWSDAVITGVTVSQRSAASGHDVRRGQYAMRLTATGTGQATRKVEFWLSGATSPTILALRGKTIITGAWIWIPNTAEFAESDLGSQHCNVTLNTYSYNGSASVQGSLLNGTYTHHTVRAGWNFLWTETAVQTDCTRLVTEVYLSTSGSTAVVTAADAYIDIGSIQIAEASVPFNDFKEGVLPDSPHIDCRFEGGRATFFTDDAPADTTQYYGDGDITRFLTLSAGATEGWACVLNGVGGTANQWKTRGATGS